MKKRIIAWVLLAGFVFLILNILIFKIFTELSFLVYLVIVAYFVLFMNKKKY